jgi:hypothetical protein
MENKEVKIKSKIDKLLPHLNERQRRIFLSADAEAIVYFDLTKLKISAKFVLRIV